MGWQHSPWVHWLNDACGMAVTFLGHTGLAAPTCINATAWHASLHLPTLHFHSHKQQGQEGLWLPEMRSSSLLSPKCWLSIQTDRGCRHSPALLQAGGSNILGEQGSPRQDSNQSRHNSLMAPRQLAQTWTYLKDLPGREHIKHFYKALI